MEIFIFNRRYDGGIPELDPAFSTEVPPHTNSCLIPRGTRTIAESPAPGQDFDLRINDLSLQAGHDPGPPLAVHKRKGGLTECFGPV
ncbi:hypothetical protein ACVWWP_003433 [Bradyrhizobium sp. LM3.6]